MNMWLIKVQKPRSIFFSNYLWSTCYVSCPMDWTLPPSYSLLRPRLNLLPQLTSAHIQDPIIWGQILNAVRSSYMRTLAVAE